MTDLKKSQKKEKINLDVNMNYSELIEKRITNINEFISGQKLRVCVVGTSGDWMFVDYGGRSEGIIAKEEFSDEKGNIVAVLDTRTTKEMQKIVDELNAMACVLSVGMTYINVEDEAEEDIKNSGRHVFEEARDKEISA